MGICMRRGFGLVFAVALCLPVGMGSASAAGTLPKCTSFTGTQTYAPGLPKAGSTEKVTPVVKTKLAIKGCSGGGITGGTSSGSQKAIAATNCDKLLADALKGKPGNLTKGTITWSNGKKSQTSSVLTITALTGSGMKAKLVTTYTGGLGKGKKSTATVTATPNAGWCKTSPLSKVNFKSTSIK